MIIQFLDWLSRINLYPYYEAWNITGVILFLIWIMVSFLHLQPKLGFFKGSVFAFFLSFTFISMIDEILIIMLVVHGSKWTQFISRWFWKFFFLYWCTKLVYKYMLISHEIRITRVTVIAMAVYLLEYLIYYCPLFFPYNFRYAHLTPYPRWFIFATGHLFGWLFITAIYLSVWVYDELENTLIYGVREYFRLWKHFLLSVKYRPEGMSVLTALNIFKSPVLYDMVRKSLKLIGIPFKRTLKTEFGNICAVKLPDGNILNFDWTERAEIFTTIEKVYKRNIYGEPPKGIVIDVGAHVGVYSLFASTYSKVYAIEPQSNNFEILNMNVYDKIVPLKYAISEVEGDVKLYQSDLTSSASLKGDGLLESYEIVRSIPLDTLLKWHDIDSVDMLKIDVEGYEMEVLRSVEPYLANKKIKALAVASYHSPSESYEVSEYLKRFGYETKVDKRFEIIVFGWI